VQITFLVTIFVLEKLQYFKVKSRDLTEICWTSKRSFCLYYRYGSSGPVRWIFLWKWHELNSF